MSEFLKRARELEEEGRLEESLNYYDIVIEEKSGPFDIRSEKGKVLNKLKQYGEAIDCFDLVLIMEENHTNSLFGKGIANLGLGNWKESFKNFYKALKLDEENANLWYYIAILLKEQNDERAEGCYKKFKDLDKLDSKFKKERSSYEFGLLFYELVRELERYDIHYNITGFKEQLSVYDLSEEEISVYLRTLNDKELREKIKQLQEELNKKEEIGTIYEGYAKLGLDKSDVDDLLEIDTIDSLKNDLISDLGYNPFVEENKIPEIEPYDNFKSMPINHAYNYRIKNNLDITIRPKNNNNFLSEIKSEIKELKEKINLGKRSNERNKKNRDEIQNKFKLLDKDIVNKNYKTAIDLYNRLKKSSTKDFEDLSIKLSYFSGLLYYFVNKDYKRALEIFENIERESIDILSNSTYLYNKGCILYDYKKYQEALNNFNAIKSTRNPDYVRYLRASAYYNLGDYENALNEYRKISNENQNGEVVQLIFKKFKIMK